MKGCPAVADNLFIVIFITPTNFKLFTPMDPEHNQYHFSFFKPTTESARHNRNMVLQFVVIWAVAIFGFQILLKVLEKPTPEPAYLLYQQSWPAIKSGDLNVRDLQISAQSALSVLGKVHIRPAHRSALDNAVSWFAWQIADSSQQAMLFAALTDFESLAAKVESITDESYKAKKEILIPILGELYGLAPMDIRGKIAPLEVHSLLLESFDDENRKVFEEAMEFYMVHNQSVLTDTGIPGLSLSLFLHCRIPADPLRGAMLGILHANRHVQQEIWY